MNFQQHIEAFCKEQGVVFERDLKTGVSFVAAHGPRDQKVVFVLDPIDPERRPGKPKGKASGKAMMELKRMEEIFRVMKDFRFFKLCLPGVFGMGRYGESFDWVMLKYYEGVRYSEADGQIPDSLAAEAAMMVFDMVQVPVLKFAKAVQTEHYPNRVAELHPQMSLLVEHGVVSAERCEELVADWKAFFEKTVPTLYTIQNGNFRPGKFLHLDESVVLLDWGTARITAAEDVIAYCLHALWRQPKWQQRFLKELEYLLDIQPEWLHIMKQWCAVQQLIAELPGKTLSNAEREYLQNQLA